MSKILPVIEIFGPTFQGEGKLAGQQTHFIRLGGCDYRCNFCDTMYAVDPEEVRKNVTKMTVEEIMEAVINLPGHPKWVTLSGGNPCLYDFYDLVIHLRSKGFRVAAETQGSIVVSLSSIKVLNLLILSPKPPSSGMATNFDVLKNIANLNQKHTFKVVVFNRGDFEYARKIREMFPYSDFWISVGSDLVDEAPERIERKILSRTETIADWILRDPGMHGVGLMPQLHVLVWGQKRGV